MRIRGYQVGRRSFVTTGLAASAGVLIAASTLAVTGSSDAEDTPPPPTEMRSLAHTSEPTGEVSNEPVEEVPDPEDPATSAERPEPVVREPGPLGIPGVAMDSYHRAAHILAEEQPACAMPWSLLAGIGQVESEHGYGRLDPWGWSEGRVLGPRLDGSIPGTATIHDTDGGRFDADPDFDRAVGPMQFIPETWEKVGRDARGGDEADPNNIYDAALSSGTLLCDAGGAMDDPAARNAAVFSYNASEAYVQNVNAWAEAFLTNTPPDPADLPPIHDNRPEVDDEKCEGDEEARNEESGDCEEGTDPEREHEGERDAPPPPPEGDAPPPEEDGAPPPPEGNAPPPPAPEPQPEPQPEPAPAPAPVPPPPGLPLPEIDLCPPICGP